MPEGTSPSPLQLHSPMKKPEAPARGMRPGGSPLLSVLLTAGMCVAAFYVGEWVGRQSRPQPSSPVLPTESPAEAAPSPAPAPPEWHALLRHTEDVFSRAAALADDDRADFSVLQQRIITERLIERLRSQRRKLKHDRAASDLMRAAEVVAIRLALAEPNPHEIQSVRGALRDSRLPARCRAMLGEPAE